jgi:predicted RNase H-like nuclease
MDGVRVAATFAEVVAMVDGVIAVDMPIGLADSGRRPCDVDARRFIRPRGCTIFSAPARPLLVHREYAMANAASRAAYGHGITRQAWNLAEKIRDVDGCVEPSMQSRVVEAHPECSYCALAGRVLPPKRTREGLMSRHAAISGVFGDVPIRVKGARADDVLDAYALLWTAQRFAANTHITHGNGERDARGLVMRIVT